jgi:hypothetical protein
MELPEDVLAIIKEYAKPVTRPDWRTLHILPNKIYWRELKKRTLLLYLDENNEFSFYVRIKNISLWI